MPTPQLRPFFLCTLSLAAALGSIRCIETDPEHCASRPGDLRGHGWCELNEPGYPLCSQCQLSSNGHHGCTDDRNEPLRCLVGDRDPGSGTDGPPLPPPTSDGSTSGSTGPMLECSAAGFDPECPAESPICVGGECMGCAACGLDDPTPPCAPGGGEQCAACDPLPGASDCAEGEFCDADYQCGDACTYHEQCGADEICDLARAPAASCLAVTKWVDASTCEGSPPDGSQGAPYCQIEDAVASQGEAFIVRVVASQSAPHVEQGPVIVQSSKRIAITGDGDRPTIAFDLASTDTEALKVDSGALYLRGVSIEGDTTYRSNGIRCSQGALWLDDVTISEFEDGLRLSGCNAPLVRRSRIHSNTGVGIYSSNTFGNTRVEASAITGNAMGGIDFGSGTLSVTYSTLLANGVFGIQCTGAEDIRNSIVSSEAGSITIDQNCQASSDNVIESGVGATMLAEWFGPDYASGQVKIVAGHEHFEGKGRWRLGDPLYDIDGQPRVQAGDVVTFAGADEP